MENKDLDVEKCRFVGPTVQPQAFPSKTSPHCRAENRPNSESFEQAGTPLEGTESLISVVFPISPISYLTLLLRE